MSLISRVRKQKAVYWAPGKNSNFGQPVVNDPVQIDCRWVDVQEEFVDAQGRTVLSKASVMVDRDVQVGGMLWLGELKNLTSQTVPTKNTNCFEIRAFANVPNFRATEFLKVATL